MPSVAMQSAVLKKHVTQTLISDRGNIAIGV